MNKKYIVISIVALALIAVLMLGTINAMFSDTETSNNNTLTAGTLDLTVNGHNGDNAQIFNVANMMPLHSQPTGNWDLKNIGSVDGTVSIGTITVANLENGITEPETQAGDVTSVGELGQVVSIVLYIDADKDGYFSVGDTTLYSGTINNLPSALNIGTLGAGATTRINAVVNWWSNTAPYDGVTSYHLANDNLAQSDSCTIDFTFTLTQL
jgi:spore coat-associated protein N